MNNVGRIPLSAVVRWKQHGAWLLMAPAALVMLAVFYAQPSGSVQQQAVYDAFGGGAVLVALIAVMRGQARSAPWLLMVVGQLSFVIGDVLWTTFDALGDTPFPSIADVAYLAGYPLIAVGLGLAIRQRISGGDRSGLLDGAILATGAGIAWWAIVLGPLAAKADPEPLAFAISVAYPLGDLLLIGMALALLATPGSKAPSVRLLIASLLTLLVADLVFSLQNLDNAYSAGGWVDGLWLTGYFLFTAAALHPSMAELVEPRPVLVVLLGPARLLLLGLAMLVGPAILMFESAEAGGILIVVAAATATLSALVLARLASMVRHLGFDIERRKALEQQLAFQAFNDPLTGLANRRRFIATAKSALDDPGFLAALFVDLDDFEDVNDNGGHDAGDDLLVAVGQRLLASVREPDLVGRLGGDEFCVLVRNVDSVDAAEEVAARLVDAVTRPMPGESQSASISASVGLALREPAEPMQVDELLRRADVAMYHAKARGKNRWATYAAAMDSTSELVRRPAVRKPLPAA